jgi:ABC-2 type transport system permease protein
MIWTRTPLYNPVVTREVRTRMRSWGSAILITVYMVLFAAIAVGFLIQQSGLPIGQASQMGVALFIILAGLQMGLILLITPSSTSTALSGERQRQTWDLLLITRLSTFRIAWGKLVSGLAFTILLMFAAPIFSFVFLFGGVGPADVFHVYLVTLATALLIGSMSILISSVSRRVVGSVIAANLAALVPTVGLTLLTVYLETTERDAYYATYHHYSVPFYPPLTPFAQLDPLIAMVSALPNPNGGSYLRHFDLVHHAFGIFGTMPMWEAYSILTPVVSFGLIVLAGRVARSRVRWLARAAS